MLYSKEAPKGRIFTDEKEYLSAIEAGWQEAPLKMVKKKD